MSVELPASPCIRECCLDGRSDICLGCYRSLAEIRAWHEADAEERERILERCAERRAADQARQRG